jgi:bifunctional DNase/RNase
MNIKKVQKIMTPDVDEANTLFVITEDDQEWYVPIVAGNAMYDEIKKQSDAGTLTIEEAD